MILRPARHPFRAQNLNRARGLRYVAHSKLLHGRQANRHAAAPIARPHRHAIGGARGQQRLERLGTRSPRRAMPATPMAARSPACVRPGDHLVRRAGDDRRAPFRLARGQAPGLPSPAIAIRPPPLRPRSVRLLRLTLWRALPPALVQLIVPPQAPQDQTSRGMGKWHNISPRLLPVDGVFGTGRRGGKRLLPCLRRSGL